MLVARVLHGENPGVQLLLENLHPLAGSLKHLRIINRRVGERLNLLPEIVEPANLPGVSTRDPAGGAVTGCGKAYCSPGVKIHSVNPGILPLKSVALKSVEAKNADKYDLLA